MLTMILLILKIVGISLLAILGLILALLLLVLFVPIRYRAQGSGDIHEDGFPCASAGISWCLGIIRAVYNYNDKKNGLTVRIFGIRLPDREEKEERRRRKEEKKRVREEKKKERRSRTEHNKDKKQGKTRVEYSMIEYDDSKGEFSEEKISFKGSEIGPQDPDPESVKAFGLVKKIGDRVKGIYNKIRNILHTLGSKAEDAGYYIDALTDDERNRQALNLIIKYVRSLLKSIRPRKLKGYVNFGTDDPADTGTVLAAAAIAYPLYGRGLRINPDFENRGLEFDVLLKGRIYIFVLLKTLAALYFNKNVKRLIRIMKKENENGR